MSTLNDLQYAWRTFRGSRLFAGISIFALALGIGASTAVFSVVNAVLLRPLPYVHPERLVTVTASFPKESLIDTGLSEPEFVDLRDQSKVFSETTAVFPTRVNLTGVAEPERLPVLYTSGNFFHLLGVDPALGRGYTAEEDAPGRNDVVVLSYDLWQQRYGGDRGIVGKKILLDDRSHTVLGVMPQGFRFGDEKVALWVPIAIDTNNLAPRSQHYLNVVARLAPGISYQRAEIEMKTLAQRFTAQYPNSYQEGAWQIDATSLRESMVGNVRPALMVLLGAIFFVLLIACANVANLLLVRAVARGREIAVRSALGASRRRLFRQLMTESLFLSVLGGIAGFVLAVLSTRTLVSFGSGQIPRLSELSIDWRVLAFTVAASVFTGLVFGVVPAIQANRPNLNELLRESTSTGGARRSHLRSALVVAELALALMLLIGSGLMIKSFLVLREINPGFNPRQVLTVQLLLPKDRYPDATQQTLFFEHAVEDVKTLPGVKVAGAVSQLPLTEDYWSSQLLVEGKVLNTVTGHPSAEVDWRTVTTGYFQAMQIPLERGRYFNDGDNQKGQLVAIVDHRLAERAWPNENPIGERLKEASFTEDKPWLTVVGEVGSVKQYGLTTQPRELVYLPQLQRATPFRAMSLVVKTSVPPRTLAGAIRSKIQSLDPNQPVSRVKTMEELFADAIAQPRFYLLLLGIFSGVALVLATIGIYGLIAYAVSQRSQELGIRMALGSDRSQLARLIVGQGLALTILGLTLGVFAALAATRVLSSILYGVSTTDPVIYVLVLLTLGGVALLASYIPARRAAQIDPAVVLRDQ